MPDYGGPSSTTMSQIEHGNLDKPAPATLRKLDTGLDWESGSARRTLHGGEPVAVGHAPNLADVDIDALLAELRRRVIEGQRQVERVRQWAVRRGVVEPRLEDWWDDPEAGMAPGRG